MPSRLRQQLSFSEEQITTPAAIKAVRRSPASSPQPPAKKQKMSLSQTYFIASAARTKLGKEATRPDHNLRLLVGHANLLDSLMLELRDAEREQEAWFNASVQKAQREEEPRHIQWVDTIVEDEDDSDFSDSDSDSEFDEAELETAIPLRRIRSPPIQITSREVSEDEDEMGYEDLEDTPELALFRTDSHPPELIDDSESDSDDVSPPTTPPQAVLEFSQKDTMLPLKSHPAHAMFERESPLITAY